MFASEIIKKHAHLDARTTKITTAHGDIFTPAFMPVGTRAFINLLMPKDLSASDTQIILGGNTYHMLCHPGMDIIKHAGGMHRFMGWDGPMLTDSGGFQVFSLSKNNTLCKIDHDGARFKHPSNGKWIRLTPETSIQAQKIIGADIIMALDECTPEQGGKARAIEAMERTHRWLSLSKETHVKNPNAVYGYQQALFGIIQGGSYRDLREQSAEFIVSLDLDGIAIGGEAIGFNMDKTVEIINWVRPLLPPEKTRYTMGVGLNPQDLIDVVAQGIDIFDCVAPTRNARHGSLYHGHVIKDKHWLKFVSGEDKQRILIKKSVYAQDERPLLEGCTCYACQQFSRAYLHYLFKQKSNAYLYLASIHNIHVMHEVCRIMRETINAC